MALPTSGQISLFAIFKEIYGREPYVGERVSFHNLVQESHLADKSFPCPFSRFYGYSHIKYTVTIEEYDLFQGSISGGGTYPKGSLCEIAATPNYNYNFGYWLINGRHVYLNPHSFILNDNTNVQVHFARKGGGGEFVEI